MSRTYAVPDLHGCYDLLVAAIEKISNHSMGHAAKLVTWVTTSIEDQTADEVIEQLINWSSQSLTLIALKGNHEAMMWRCCKNLSDVEWWIKNGGDKTLMSYGQPPARAIDLACIPSAHLDWIAALTSIHVDSHRIYVHAGVDSKLALDQQGDQILLWKRYPQGYRKGFGKYHVVHGHHANVEGPIVVSGKTNLDTMAWKTGRLAIGFSTMKSRGPIDILEIRL